MKVVAVVMILVGAVLGYGAAMEFRYFGLDATQFWLGAFTTPASHFFLIAGARRIVVAASGVVAPAIIGATLLRVMGPPTTLMGRIGVRTGLPWAWRQAIPRHAVIVGAVSARKAARLRQSAARRGRLPPLTPRGRPDALCPRIDMRAVLPFPNNAKPALFVFAELDELALEKLAFGRRYSASFTAP